MEDLKSIIDISHTKGDTFLGEILPNDGEEFEEGTKVQFIISESETSTPIIDKVLELSDGMFKIALSPSETSKLQIQSYLYKLILLAVNGDRFTQISGDFTVKWGA